MSFLETPRFPERIAYGSTGGPGYNTDVVVINSGYEQRNASLVSRATYDVSHGIKDQADMDTLIAFFRNCKGRAHGFRFRDSIDHSTTHSTGVLTAGIGTGTPTHQLYKNYVTGALTESRLISKPVANTVEVKRGGVVVTYGGSAGNISIDNATGIITFVADAAKTINANISKTITGITQANPGVVTAVGHGFSTNDKIRIDSVAGMTEVNGLYFTITFLTADTFSIGVNTTAYGAYTSGGTAIKYGATQTNAVRIHSTAHGFSNGNVIYIAAAGGMTQINNLAFTVSNSQTDYFDLSGINGTAYSLYTSGGTISKYPQSSETLTWSGEFDVPCRFDVDQMKASHDAYGYASWGGIPIVEIRV